MPYPCLLGSKIRKRTDEWSVSYKDFNTPARLGELTDSKLASLGVSDKDDRRLVLSALNAGGYRATAVTNAKQREAKKRRAADDSNLETQDDDEVTQPPPPPPKSGEPSTVTVSSSLLLLSASSSFNF